MVSSATLEMYSIERQNEIVMTKMTMVMTSSHDDNHEGASSAAPMLSIARLEMRIVEIGGDD